jgi:hypothetical protein
MITSVVAGADDDLAIHEFDPPAFHARLHRGLHGFGDIALSEVVGPAGHLDRRCLAPGVGVLLPLGLHNLANAGDHHAAHRRQVAGGLRQIAHISHITAKETARKLNMVKKSRGYAPTLCIQHRL